MPRAVALILTLSLLALPVAAAAQSAGDEQYSDPFGQAEEPSDPQGQPEATQEQAAPEAAPAVPAQEQAVDAQESAAPTLPRTGAQGHLLAGAGVLLLAAGATLRRLAL
jgi:LPXTG-motif cell wall-anchored protein